MDTTKTITHISLCAGYGGIDIGLKRAIPNLRTICFSEIEAFPIANLVSKMEKGYLDTAPIWTDLKTFPWKEFRGVVDIVSGGFPCQPFSAAGKRNADTDERHLFPYILQGIRECQPSLVFLENVEGIISSKLSGDGWRDPEGTPVLLHVLRELERVGYKATAGVFSASEVGAPHQRKRVFIMAHNDSNGSGQSRLLQQRADGKVIISNGEAGRVELAHGEDKRCRGRSDRNRNNSRGISEQETQLKSVLRGEVEGCCGDTRKTLWPSRPGQQQYWWEPPRVVAHTMSRTCKESRRADRELLQEGSGLPGGQDQGEARQISGSCSEGGLVNTSSLRLECPRDEGGLAEEGRRTKGKGSKSTSTSEESSHTSMENSNSTRGRSKGGDTLHQGWTTSQGGSEGISQDSEGGDGIAITDNQSAGRDGNKATINEIKSSVGRDITRSPSRMVLAELYTANDSRNDELRLLGNGVVPQTCTKAFIILFDKLMNEGKLKEEQGTLNL